MFQVSILNLLWIVFLIGIISCGPPPPPKKTGQGEVDSTSAQQETRDKKNRSMDTAYFLDRFGDLSSLAQHKPNERLVLRSSNDPNGAKDVNNFAGSYRIDGVTWNILLDEKGPGCITRLWMTGWAEGRLQIYFDQESNPRIDTTIQNFFSSEYIQSATFLAYSQSSSGGGYVSYLPLPFKKSCQILTDSTTADFKYQANVLKFEKGANVETYSPDFDQATGKSLKKLTDQLSQVAFQRFQSVNKKKFGPVTIGSKETKLVARLTGPAAIDYFQLTLNPITSETVQGVRLQIYWDDIEEPAIDCSLRSFFCSNVEVKSWNSVPLGFWGEKNLFYSQFFMPFRKKAEIYLVNDSDKDVTLNFEYHLIGKQWNKNSLHFYARSHKRELMTGFIYPFLELEGKGNFVGWNLLSASQTIEPKYFYLTGDEYFYVDGEQEASWLGTGEDNYFNGDDFFGEISHFWVPTHGCLIKMPKAGGVTHCFRFHFLDAVPFNTSLVLIKEIGCPIQYAKIETSQFISTQTEWTCFWYSAPTNQSVTRNENLYYFAIDQQENSQPSHESPLMRNMSLHINLPPGEWWFHVAPIWDISQVQHMKKVVQPR